MTTQTTLVTEATSSARRILVVARNPRVTKKEEAIIEEINLGAAETTNFATEAIKDLVVAKMSIIPTGGMRIERRIGTVIGPGGVGRTVKIVMIAGEIEGGGPSMCEIGVEVMTGIGLGTEIPSERERKRGIDVGTIASDRTRIPRAISPIARTIMMILIIAVGGRSGGRKKRRSAAGERRRSGRRSRPRIRARRRLLRLRRGVNMG